MRSVADRGDPPTSVTALQGTYVRSELREPARLMLIGLLALFLGLVIGVEVDPALGAAAALLTVIAGAATSVYVARRRAADDFFAAYASERGLKLVDEGLPQVTPLLYAGSSRVTELAIEGELAEGLSGMIAHYTYAEPSGGGPSTSFKLTVVLVDVPETAAVFPKLLCHGRHGSQGSDKLDDALGKRGLQRLKLESEVLNRRFEIFIDPRDDELRLRRLFSPSFIVWLAETMPTAFELVNGHLCCFASGHLDSAADLDSLVWGTAELARRLETEATE